MLATGTPRDSVRCPVGRPALLLLGTGLALLDAVFVTAAGAYAWPDEPVQSPQTTIVGDAHDFEPGSVTPLWNVGVTGYLVRLDEFLAFGRAEPVLGCTLLWDRHGDRSSGMPVTVTSTTSPATTHRPIIRPECR